MIVNTAMCDLCGSTLTGWCDRAGAEEEITGCGWVRLLAYDPVPGSWRDIHVCQEHPIGTGTMCPECDADLDAAQWFLIAGSPLDTLIQKCHECGHVTALGVHPYREVP